MVSCLILLLSEKTFICQLISQTKDMIIDFRIIVPCLIQNRDVEMVCENALEPLFMTYVLRGTQMLFTV